jgi:hypothetical protein
MHGARCLQRYSKGVQFGCRAEQRLILRDFSQSLQANVEIVPSLDDYYYYYYYY